MASEQNATQPRFVVRAHVGPGPWRWEIQDLRVNCRVVGLYVDRDAAGTNAAELNKKGFVDA